MHHSLTVSPLAFWSEKRVVHSFIRSWCNFCFVFMRDASEYLLGELRESHDSSYMIQEIFSQKYDIMIRYLWLRIYFKGKSELFIVDTSANSEFFFESCNKAVTIYMVWDWKALREGCFFWWENSIFNYDYFINLTLHREGEGI